MDKFKDFLDKIATDSYLSKDYKREDPVQLYDYNADPNEMHNLAEKLPDKVAELKGQLEQHQQEIAAAEVQTRKRYFVIDEETQSQLKALGYIK